jgi:hypothetical protein
MKHTANEIPYKYLNSCDILLAQVRIFQVALRFFICLIISNNKRIILLFKLV